MSKFAGKLAALPPLAEARADARAQAQRASLEELRGRIQAILRPEQTHEAEPARASAPPDGFEASDVLSEFCERELIEADAALRYFGRSHAMGAGHRVGHAPLWAACSANATVLSLLALDPSLSGVDLSRALFLDTETTGLMGGTGTVAFLLGLGFFDGESFVVEQILLRTFEEERAMLRHLEQRLAEASVIVTYNGKTFDLPLLRARAVMNRVPRLAEPPHLDLLHVARRLHRHRLPSCSLKSVEANVLGRERVGDVDGADIGAMYWHYVRTGDAEVLRGVLEHNLLDVVSMIALVGLYGESLEEDVHSADLAMAARTAHRAMRKKALRAGFLETPDAARALTRAEVWASVALERGRSDVELVALAEVLASQGEKAQAIVHYEEALALLTHEVDELGGDDARARAEPVRHALVKLYEHATKDFDRALLTLSEGTGEVASMVEKRRARLTAKLVKKREATTRLVPARRRRSSA